MKFVRHNKDRILLVLVLFVLIGMFIGYVYKTIQRRKEKDSAKTLDVIEKYDYYLYDIDGDVYNKTFQSLKENLSSDNIDEELYAKEISVLFVIDFYTLNNKNTNMDIGGLQYIDPSMKDNFILKASDTVYKHVQSNIYGDRNQQLPVVDNAVVKSIEKIEYAYNSKTYVGYDVEVNLEYEVDMGYPSLVKLTLIKKDYKLVVVEVK